MDSNRQYCNDVMRMKIENNINKMGFAISESQSYYPNNCYRLLLSLNIYIQAW